MEAWVSLLILAFAVSVDSFGVGMTYGMRKLRITMLPIVFIGICSLMSVFIAGFLADMLFLYIPTSFGDYLGGAILICIGLWAIRTAYQPGADSQQTIPARKQPRQPHARVFNLEIKRLGLVIQVLRKPTTADLDGSGTISMKEAGILGVALSLDAFGAGFGAAMLGYSTGVFALFVSLMCVIFLLLGKKGGFKLANKKIFQKFGYLPGLILMFIGVSNFL